MASLTPLSKGLIGLAVVGGMASAVWHLALKERVGSNVQSTAPATTSPPAQQPTATITPTTAATPTPVATSNQGAPKLSAAENAERGRQLLAQADFAQARVHLEQAVQDGDGSAACHLGDMTLKGQGGIKADQEQAAKLFQLAQSRGIICFAPGQ